MTTHVADDMTAIDVNGLIEHHADETALVIIDMQQIFCDPAQAIPEGGGNMATRAASQKISSLIPHFRNAGVSIYPVYFCDEDETIDCYKYTPTDEDTVVLKDRCSAFAGGDIEAVLKNDNKKLLLTCGFNMSACVRATVEDARKSGFEVCVMDDITKDGVGYTQKENANAQRLMRNSGVTFSHSNQVLEALKKQSSLKLAQQRA